MTEHDPDRGRPPAGPARAIAMVLLLGACAAPPPHDAPAPPTCPTITSGSGFRAGFARVDITTPPGPGLLGYGPEGLASRGHRQRIHARAVAFEDARGERLVLIVADLDFIPARLHREVARHVAACTGLGADRIIVSATHTHSAPSHFSGHASYDRYGSSVNGFDAGILDFFATRLTRIALDALAGMRPAQAAWGERPVWGISRIRSWDAHSSALHPLPSPYTPPATLTDQQYRHVDPTLLLLRVDTGPVARLRPAGAFAIFAVHGTGVPAANDLLDADVHGIATRVLERHIDSLNGAQVRFAPNATVLLANSAEGDVVPARDSVPACDLPVLRRASRPAGRGGAPGEEAWIARPGFNARECVDYGLERTRHVGGVLGREALMLFDSLGGALTSSVNVGLAFEMVALRGAAAIPGLCERGRSGTATTAGAETGRTRLLGFRLLGLFAAGFESGRSAIAPGAACESPKRTIPGLLERAVVGEHPFEEAAQFTVLRIGDALLATVPFEATTTTGSVIRDSLRAVASRHPIPPSRTAVLGLANGYLNYVTTAAEYAQQHYEGASTLYGPGSAVAYTGRIAGLARRLATAGWASPPVIVPPFPFPPTSSKRIMPAALLDPGLTSRAPRVREVDRRAVIVRYRDGLPGSFIPADAPLVAIEHQTAAGWTRIAWDDDPAVEVRVVSTARRRALWQVRWAHGCATPGTYRVVLLARHPLPEESVTFNVACP
ncbi:MAG: neutral/alkaline non-lysosomal ceramidase N-terminal domain-containing protein [Gemmatimonadetes bacterium]|nr:neutral/alkaline non-lysosomal ceramidase N-terminal domain-containing protein [Gemmatimonadota bacterium]